MFLILTICKNACWAQLFLKNHFKDCEWRRGRSLEAAESTKEQSGELVSKGRGPGAPIIFSLSQPWSCRWHRPGILLSVASPGGGGGSLFGEISKVDISYRHSYPGSKGLAQYNPACSYWRLNYTRGGTLRHTRQTDCQSGSLASILSTVCTHGWPRQRRTGFSLRYTCSL